MNDKQSHPGDCYSELIRGIPHTIKANCGTFQITRLSLGRLKLPSTFIGMSFTQVEFTTDFLFAKCLLYGFFQNLSDPLRFPLPDSQALQNQSSRPGPPFNPHESYQHWKKKSRTNSMSIVERHRIRNRLTK